MRLVGKERLLSLRGIDSEVDIWISAWVSELNHANWLSDLDLQDCFPKALKIEGTTFVFPIVSSQYRIKVVLCFQRGIALISEVITNE